MEQIQHEKIQEHQFQAFGYKSAELNTFDNVSAIGYKSQPTKDNQVMLRRYQRYGGIYLW